MARKRKSSEMEPPRLMPENVPEPNGRLPPNGRELEQRFKAFRDSAGLTLKHNVITSPAKSSATKEGQIWELYRFLYWQNRDELEKTENDFFWSLPTTPDSGRYDVKLNVILERLNKLRYGTPRRDRRKEPLAAGALSPSAMPTLEEFSQPCPSSPTPAFRKSVVEDSKQTGSSTKKASSSLPRKQPHVLPSSSRNPSATPINAYFGIQKQITPHSSKPVGADISFATTVGADSIFTQPTRSATQETAATDLSSDEEEFYSAKQTETGDHATSESDVDMEDHSQRESTNYSWSLDTNARGQLYEMMAEMESSQDSMRTDRTIRPRRAPSAHASLSSRDTERFGSSLGPSTVAEADEAYMSNRCDDPNIPDNMYAGISAGPVPTSRPPNDSFTSPNRPKMNPQQPYAPKSVLKTDMAPFVDLQIPPAFRNLPFELQWEVQRLLQTGRISPEELAVAWPQRTLGTLYDIQQERKIPFERPPKFEMIRDFEVATRYARVEWSTSASGAVCEMIVMNQRKDVSCALQRWIGGDRVMYLDLPDLSKPTDAQKGRNILPRFREWLKSPHKMLGRTWYSFFLQPNKKRSQSEGRATAAMNRLILIAPREGLTLCDILNSALPYDRNSTQAARKAYMRLELLLSRTIVVAKLEPDDFAFVHDQLATRDPDDRRFEDPALKRFFYEEYDRDTVMSDGTCTMKPWIAWQWAKKTGRTALPPALQCRTAGGKGLWIIDDTDRRSIDAKPSKPIINVADSQVKVHRNTLRGAPDHVLEVNVVKANPGARASLMHILFLPIFIDRGVPASAIRELVEAQVQGEMDEFLRAVESPDPIEIRRWMSSQNEFWEARRRELGLETIAGFPAASQERIIQMLESGFSPKANRYLADQIYSVAKDMFDLKNKRFKIQLSKSTTLWGIPDPYGCLEPGEVCVIFAEPFTDPAMGPPLWFLHDMEGLVARNPALAPWDIQKIRFVFKPELARFTDLIVFSTKGMRPLANKLQGGDYDGDSFWITWEPKLVEPFKNAPAPFKPPEPESLGIRKDTSLLSNYVDNPNSNQQWLDWLGEMTCKRMSLNLLGIATLTHEQLIYAGYGIGSTKAQSLVHVHDYLVDSDKQGYEYTKDDFFAWKKRAGIPANLPRPDYWEFTRHDDGDDKNIREREVPNAVKGSRDNIIDAVYFKSVEPIIQSTLDRVHRVLSGAGCYDSDLSKFYKDTLEATSGISGRDMHKELLRLKDQLKALRGQWIANIRQHSWAENIQRMRAIYDDIQPENPRSPFAIEWLRRQGNGYTIWDKLKASCLARTQYKGLEKPGQFMFNVAGAELCYLKLNELGEDTRIMLKSHYQALKMRSVRVIETRDDFDDGAEGDQQADEAGYY